MLDWIDSGVDGPPAPGSLAAASPVDVENAIAAIVEEVRPDIVVTLDASDGHRDHAGVRDATLAAIQRTRWRPSRTYLWCLPPFAAVGLHRQPHRAGTPDETITTVVDTAEHLDLRWRAMRAHASQAPPCDAMDPELQRAFLVHDHLLRADRPWTAGPIEPDWLPTSGS